MKPILPSFLALIAASLGPVEARAAWQQPQTIWVDVENPNPGNGTGSQADSYHSVSFAITQVKNSLGWNPGDIIKIAGRSTHYTDDLDFRGAERLVGPQKDVGAFEKQPGE